MNVPTSHLLIVATGLFTIGAIGFLVRRNAIVMLLCVELMLNAANLAFVAGSRAHFDAPGALPGPDGVVFSLFVIVVAAIEAAVGLAIVIAMYRLHRSVQTESLQELAG